MILHRLPRPGRHADIPHTGVYADHTLYTDIVESAYNYPEHIAGLGIFTMLSGSGECRVNQQRESLGSEDWMLVDRGSRLSMHLSQTGSQPVLLFFHSLAVQRLWEGVSFSPLERVHSGALTFRRRLEELVSLGSSCSSFSMLKADSIVRAILEELIGQAREAALLSGRLLVAKESTRTALFKRLSAARDWMLLHYSAPITLDDMAVVALLNRQHFLRMFRQCYQQTPHQYLTELRLQRAVDRLLHSGDSVTVICQECGFESLSSFSGMFRQRFGISPAGFRSRGQIRS